MKNGYLIKRKYINSNNRKATDYMFLYTDRGVTHPSFSNKPQATAIDENVVDQWLDKARGACGSEDVLEAIENTSKPPFVYSEEP